MNTSAPFPRFRIICVIASIALPITAVADEPITTSVVLQNIRAAVGFDRLAHHPNGLQLTGTATIAECEGQFSMVYSDPRHMIERVTGPLTVVNATNGDSVWLLDFGGEQRLASGGEREQTLVSAEAFLYGWLSDTTPLTFDLDTAVTTAEAVVLSFTNSQGYVSGTVQIDRATWLPSSWKYSAGTNTQTVTLAGSIEFDGIKIPAHITRRSDDGEGTSVTINACTDAPTFIRSPYEFIPAPLNNVKYGTSVPAELEVVKAKTGHLLVHPLVNGQDVGWFIFDTGAGSNVLDNRAKEMLKLESIGKITVTGVGGSTSSGFYHPDSISLGRVTLEHPSMIAIDLSFLDVYMGHKIAGVLGYGLLARCVATIDMVAPTIALEDPAVFKADNLTWSKLELDGRVAQVEASFEGHTGMFRVDTGAAGSTVAMHAPAVERLKLLENRATTPATLGGVGGLLPAKAGVLEWFEIGGNRSEKLKVTFATERKGAFADPYSLGNIGGDLLNPFRLVFDYPHSRMAFIKREPAPATDHPTTDHAATNK